VLKHDLRGLRLACAGLAKITRAGKTGYVRRRAFGLP
jgi:hypothetical protein